MYTSLSKDYYQWSMMLYGIGEIVGGLLVAMMAARWSPQNFLFCGILVNGMEIALSGFSSFLWLTLSATFFIALTQPCIFIGVNTMIFKLSPIEMVEK